MNKDIVLASCFDAAEFLKADLPVDELGVQLDLAGYIDIFKKAVSGPIIEGHSGKVDNKVLAKISDSVLALSSSNSPLKDISMETWHGLNALKPAVESFLNCEIS